MKKMKKFAALLLAVSMAAGMVACGSSDKKEETTKKEETKKDDKETKKLEGTLKVVTTGDAYQPLFDKFTEEVGPKVEFISMSSGEVLSKLKAEGGTPAADLWFGGGIDAFMDAKDNDLLEKVDFDAADELAPEGRVKPWGTGHAVLSCIDEIDGPFAVINADDYYGRHAFEAIYNYLSEHEDDDKYRYAMVGYLLKNTVTDNGHVARGICTTNEEGELVNITERTRIEKRDGKIAFTENDGETWENLPEDTLVSMNMWGFTRSILDELKAEFPQFLKKGLTENPMKCEYFLPAVVSNLLEADRATAAVLPSEDKWYGVTYKEDKPVVVEAIRNLKKEGLYPENLWEE